MIATNKELELVRQVVADLDRHEGFREFSYPDPLSKLYKKHANEKWGFKPSRDILSRLGVSYEDADKLGAPWTVGYGFTHGVNPDTRIPKQLAKRKLEELVLAVHRDLFLTLTWYKDSTTVTKTVLINMYYNLGRAGLLGFRNTLQYISERNYKQAAANMLKSLWAKQVGNRARELARRLETQEIPDPFKAPDTV